MSLHQSDYESLIASMMGWFGNAVTAGATPQTALIGVVGSVLMSALQHVTPTLPASPPAASPAAPAPAAPPVTVVEPPKPA